MTHLRENPEEVRRFVINILTSLLGNKNPNIEDIAHNILTECLEKDRSPSIPLIKSRLIDFYRKENLRKTEKLSPLIPDKPPSQNEPELLEAIKLLETEPRLILIEHFFLKKSITELSKERKKSPLSIKTSLQSSKTFLRNHLEALK